MNFGMALAPWAFGLLADAAGTNWAIITGILFSIFAALANSPLMWHPLSKLLCNARHVEIFFDAMKPHHLKLYETA